MNTFQQSQPGVLALLWPVPQRKGLHHSRRLAPRKPRQRKWECRYRFASSKGVELVVDWLGSVWLAALAAHPLKTADAQSAIVSKRVVIFCFFIF